MTFDTFSLDPQILKAVVKEGYTKPTKIQSDAIPEIQKGTDIRASAQTGTGKTAAFLLPILDKLVKSDRLKGHRNGPRVLVLVPTRELAVQITEQAQKYSQFLSQIKTVCISGGVSYQLHAKKLSKSYDVLVATPGRLVDYIERGKIDLSKIEVLVLDEADRMLDMGFTKSIEQIVAEIPEERQTLLFSATMHKNILALSDKLLQNPLTIKVHEDGEKHQNIQQKLHYVDNLSHKNRLLEHILNDQTVQTSIIFTATKKHAEQLQYELKDKGYRVAALHGDMNQGQRNRAIQRFKEGKVNVLVATDVAARGLHVEAITHVINFDLPRNIEDYVHRIGRTGRAEATGVALSFAAERDRSLVKRIESFIGQQIDVSEIAGLEPSPSSRVTAIHPRKNKRPSNQRTSFSSTAKREERDRENFPPRGRRFKVRDKNTFKKSFLKK